MPPVWGANFYHLPPYMHPSAQYSKATGTLLQEKFLQDQCAQLEEIENLKFKVHVAMFIMKTPVLAQDLLFYEAAKATLSQVSMSTS